MIIHGREKIRRAAHAALWIALALLTAAWIGLAFFYPLPALSEETPTEVSGQVSWVDPQAGAFGLSVNEEEMEFTVTPETVITRDAKTIALEDVQPGEWAAACSYRLSGEKHLCLRLEIQTPSGEEGFE